MVKFKYLTGVKPTGEFHVGNYASIIKPIIDNNLQCETLVLIADLHAMTGNNFKQIKENTKNIFYIFKSFGIKNIILQSAVPSITELYWLFSCYTAKGLMNRAHGYKSTVETNLNNNKDTDKGVFMGEYTYPILMTVDLCVFDNDFVFIGQDQKQHIDIARDIVNKINHESKANVFKVAEPIINNKQNILGFDGRKMSKSYNNTIPLFGSTKKLKANLNKVKTNLKKEGESKDYDETPLTTIFDVFATEKQKTELKHMMQGGASWKLIKNFVFETINIFLYPHKHKYYEMIEKQEEMWLTPSCTKVMDNASDKYYEIIDKL